MVECESSLRLGENLYPRFEEEEDGVIATTKLFGELVIC